MRAGLHRLGAGAPEVNRIPQTVRRRLALISLLALGLPLMLPPQAHAQKMPGSLADAIEATFLLKFPPFITWPSALPPDAFTVCAIGNTPVEGLLEQAASGQAVEQRPVIVQQVADASAARGCQELFVAGKDTKSIAAALAAVRGAPVLTITSGQTKPADKGVINFVLAGDRVRFEIDLAAAAANGITISSKLLSIAIDVHGSAQ